MTADWYNDVRAVNIVLSLVLFGLMVVQFRRWAGWPEQIRLLGVGLALLLLSTVYGTIESYLRGIPGGPRVVFMTIPLLVILIGCAWPYVRHWQRVRRRRLTRRAERRRRPPR